MCGNSAIRRMLVFFNVIFLLLSIGLIGIGSWIISGYSVVLSYVPLNLSDDKLLIQDIGIAAVSIGIVSALISFFGCCGAARQNRKMLFTFMIIMMFIFMAVLISGILAMSRQELVKQVVYKTLQYESNLNDTDAHLFRLAHKEYGCCGIEDLATCDKTYPPSDVCVMGSTLCKHGCLGMLWEDMLAPYIQIAALVLFILSGIVLVGITFAGVQFKAISQGEYTYVRHYEQ